MSLDQVRLVVPNARDALHRVDYPPLMRDTGIIFWKAYSFVTGFAADLVALALGAGVLAGVHATPLGIVIAALIIEVPLLVSGVAFSWLLTRWEVATTDESKGGYGLLVLASLCLALAWMAVGLVFADLVTTKFNIAGTWPYLGTLALIGAAEVAVYLPLHLRRRVVH
jgi:hypothetical protein